MFIIYFYGITGYRSSALNPHILARCVIKSFVEGKNKCIGEYLWTRGMIFKGWQEGRDVAKAPTGDFLKFSNPIG